MKSIKKFLSLFLVLCLVLSYAPLIALADETGTESGPEITRDEEDYAAEAAAETDPVKAYEENSVVESEKVLAETSEGQLS